MTIFQLILLLLQNKEAILDLVKLVKDLLRPGTVVTLSDEAVQAMGVSYPALYAVGGSAKSFLDLIKLIIENKDQIIELIKFIRELIGSVGTTQDSFDETDYYPHQPE